MTRLMLTIALILVGVTGAQAHSLVVYATVEGSSVSGYGFFVGGGRPEGALVRAVTDQGDEVFRGETDGDGGFTFPVETPATLTIIVDLRDGHMARTTIEASRFAQPDRIGEPLPAISEAAVEVTFESLPPGESPPPVAEGEPEADGFSRPEPVALAAEDLRTMIDQSVRDAVASQIRPLLAAHQAAESRIRINDVLGGIGMIVGVTGIVLWVSARRRARRDTPA